VDQVVREDLAARPPRNSQRKYPNEISWNGYLNGEFLTRDNDGAILVARRIVERQPDLMAFMREPTRLVAVPCSTGVCDGATDVKVPFEVLRPSTPSAAATWSWQPVNYGRSFVQYRVELMEPMLVIENELYARGWRASIDHHSDQSPVRVNQALRGSVVPAGEHALILSFHTPGLEPGLVVSAAAMVLYALALHAATLAVTSPRSSTEDQTLRVFRHPVGS
jgi:hypothetical protein